MDTTNPTFHVPTEEEKFSIVLEEANTASYHGVKVNDIMRVMLERVDDMQNPNKALINELEALVLAKKSPVTEKYMDYKKRMINTGEIDKANPSSYFLYAFGRFYDAGILYKNHIRAMDGDFYNLMANTKDPNIQKLPTKSDFLDYQLKNLDPSDLRQSMNNISATYRRKRINRDK